jgi:phage tail sheath protein FI
MANIVSPGVYVIEKDISEYSPTIDSSIVGLVGFASKGPVNEATLITSPQQLINTFGKPSESIPGQALEGAIEILEATNKVYFVRGVTNTATEASALIPLGGCPAVCFTNSGLGVSASIYLKVNVSDSAGVNQYLVTKEFAIPSGTVAATASGGQALALKTVIGGSLDSDKVGIFYSNSQVASGFLVGAWAGSGAALSVTAYADAAYTTGVSALAAVNFAGSLSANLASTVHVLGTSFATTGASSVGYYVESLYPGNGYNLSTDSTGATTGNSFEINSVGGEKFVAQVNQNGAALETFKADLINQYTFIEEVINTGSENTTSEVIKGYIVSGASRADIAAVPLGAFTDPLSDLGVASIVGAGQGGNGAVSARMFVKPIEGTYGLSAGTNGTSNDDDTNALALIGDPSQTPKTGIYALDDDTLNISIALTPGLNNQSLQNSLITLAEQTQNFLALVAPPYGSVDTVQEAIDWTNGRSETRTASINSSYGAVFWPWVKVYSVFDGIDRWYDPTIYAARQMCYTDSIADPWFAPAGFQRGRLTKPIDVDVVLNQGDRDSLYSGGNIVNPIVEFPQRGITIFGQRTAQRAPTALDRINVRRLMIYLRKVLLASTQTFVFEPNDPITWENIVGVVDPILDDIRRRRGIVEYKVVCDETTNTPVRVDRNELWCKILLKPTKTAEIIVFEINVTNQSAKLGG